MNRNLTPSLPCRTMANVTYELGDEGMFFGFEEELLPPKRSIYFLLGRLTDGIPILLLLLAFLIFVIRQLALQ